MKKKVYLTLENGKTFQGYSFGATGEAIGELVFSTGMVGYMETLTDPANYGQIVVQTFPLIGNYGAIEKDVESDKAWVSAYVVREICDNPSNFRCEGLLEEYLKKQGVIGIYGVDTRELTKIVRETGVVNAKISNKPLTDEEIKALRAFSVKNSMAEVCVTTRKEHGNNTAEYKVALWNFGAKNSTIQAFVNRGCYVIDMPASSTAEEILSLDVDGVVVAGEVNYPEESCVAVEEMKKLLGKIPVFGIDFGHLLTAVALGAKVKKQKYGHRGGNQPVKCVDCGRVYVSSQNHGYEVVSSTVKEGYVKFVNVNDGSCEGIDYPTLRSFTVQFAPEACDLGNVENTLYKKFFALMRKEK